MELCSPAYFSTLGANLLQGRMLSDEDIDTARHVAVINEQFARNYYPKEDPIGKTVKFNSSSTGCPTRRTTLTSKLSDSSGTFAIKA